MKDQSGKSKKQVTIFCLSVSAVVIIVIGLSRYAEISQSKVAYVATKEKLNASKNEALLIVSVSGWGIKNSIAIMENGESYIFKLTYPGEGNTLKEIFGQAGYYKKTADLLYDLSAK